MGRGRWSGIAWLAVVGFAGVATPQDVRAQSLHLAELFAEQGRLDNARAEVAAWFEIRGQEATPEELQHGSWLRARFARDPAEGARELETFVREYPRGPFTARALAWMAAVAADQGGEARAIELYTRVLEDFPESDRVAEARDWLERHGVAVDAPDAPALPEAPAVPVPDTAAAPVESPVETPPDTAVAPVDLPTDTAAPPPVAMVADSTPEAPPEVRVDSVAASVPDSTAASSADTVVVVPADTVPPAPPPAEVAPTEVEVEVEDPAPAEAAPERPRGPMEGVPHGPPVPGAAEGGRWAVQIGAYRNPDGAAGLVAELREAGFDARLIQVPLNDLVRVRVGRFETQDGAADELARVREAGYDGGLVNDARDETVVER